MAVLVAVDPTKLIFHPSVMLVVAREKPEMVPVAIVFPALASFSMAELIVDWGTLKRSGSNPNEKIWLCPTILLVDHLEPEIAL